MTANKGAMEVHAGSGNEYTDLGFPNAPAMLRRRK